MRARSPKELAPFKDLKATRPQRDHRVPSCIEAIRVWADREIIADRVTMEVRQVVDNYGDIIVRGV